MFGGALLLVIVVFLILSLCVGSMRVETMPDATGFGSKAPQHLEAGFGTDAMIPPADSNVLAAPHRRSDEPSLPITGSHHPTDATQQPYMVKYMNASDRIVTECLGPAMASEIPHERVFGSSTNAAGELCVRCDAQGLSPYKPWPF